MPGPTTEVLNEDIRDIRSDMATMRADVHAIAMGLAEFKAEARIFMRMATWTGAFLATAALTGGVAAVWWAASLTADVRQLGVAASRIEGRLSSIETKIGTGPTIKAAELAGALKR